MTIIKGFGCTTTKVCPQCNWSNVCDSSGKAGSKDEEKRIIYMLGPCNEGMRYCLHCNYDFKPWWDSVVKWPSDIAPQMYFNIEYLGFIEGEGI